MKCPLCDVNVTEAELDYNVKETLKGFAPNATKYWPSHRKLNEK